MVAAFCPKGPRLGLQLFLGILTLQAFSQRWADATFQLPRFLPSTTSWQGVCRGRCLEECLTCSSIGKGSCHPSRAQRGAGR